MLQPVLINGFEGQIDEVHVYRRLCHNVKAGLSAFLLDCIINVGRTGYHQRLGIDKPRCIPDFCVALCVILTGCRTLCPLSNLLFVELLVDVEYLLAGLVAIHDGHCQVQNDGIEVLRLSAGDLLAFGGVLELVELKHILLDLSDG